MDDGAAAATAAAAAAGGYAAAAGGYAAAAGGYAAAPSRRKSAIARYGWISCCSSASRYRWSPEGYVVHLTAGRRDRVRAAPFEDIEIEIALLFGG